MVFESIFEQFENELMNDVVEIAHEGEQRDNIKQ